ncbi:3-keto-5-aminohexanoate cleavage protein [Candidatus Woesearchaeota archaeon]|nr:3-keto-5-aminohexanoate cleavage protein [Candidatus Woesearchaeota archaeon]
METKNERGKLIINFTPNGMIPTKEMTPFVPISPEEIANDVLKAAELGASIVHLHAREPDGTPSTKKEIFAEIIRRIRAKNKEIIIGVTTSGRNINTFEARSEVLDLDGDVKPDMGSLTLSSLNFNKSASVNSPEVIQKLATKMLERGIKPELEAFDIGMINYAKYLITKEIIKPPFYFNLLFGNIACAQADLINAGLMIRELPESSTWAFAGIGDHQLKMNTLGIIWEGNVRVGLEDNIYFDNPKRTQLATNIQLVERIAKLAKAYGREIATPREVRKILGLRAPEEI